MKVRALYCVIFALVACEQGAPRLHAQAAARAAATPVRVRTAASGFELSSQAGKSPNQIGGASRDLGRPTLFAPKLGKSYTLHPVFHWAVDAGDKVTFRLSAPGGEVVYETATSAKELAYPADAPPLTPGTTYAWTVVPENDLLGGKPVVASVTIVGGAEREQTAQELSGVAVGMGSADLFVKHHDWYDAVQSYSELLQSKPADSNLLAARALLYDELPVTAPLATADRAGIH